ncbi:MAG: NAD(P)/FAD-dependent oxidoreductase [Rudaea sp.]
MPASIEKTFHDAIVLGAGAAGLFCAAKIAQSGKRVAVIDHAATLGEKIRISGGGRCNFTNRDTKPDNFISENPGFCRSALARYTPQDFIKQIERHSIAWHEKHKGQLFCDGSAQQIVRMLVGECADAGVEILNPVKLNQLRSSDLNAARFALDTSHGAMQCRDLVIATGGLSIPKIGASDLGYRIGKQFDIAIVPTAPALVPLTIEPDAWAPFAPLSGVALQAVVSLPSERVGKNKTPEFIEDLLFTHRGLSGPGILQISSYWQLGKTIAIDFAQGTPLDDALIERKTTDKRALHNVLGDYLPQRLADYFGAQIGGAYAGRKLSDLPDNVLRELGRRINDWRIEPNGSEGYRKAEVTRGGIDTRGLSSKTMESAAVSGLYFIGEVVDVTGWLGGYNFQWAWASAIAAAKAIGERRD